MLKTAQPHQLSSTWGPDCSGGDRTATRRGAAGEFIELFGRKRAEQERAQHELDIEQLMQLEQLLLLRKPLRWHMREGRAASEAATRQRGACSSVEQSMPMWSRSYQHWRRVDLRNMAMAPVARGSATPAIKANRATRPQLCNLQLARPGKHGLSLLRVQHVCPR